MPIHAFALQANDGPYSVEWQVTAFADVGWIADTIVRGACWSTPDTPEASLTAKEVLIDARLLREFQAGVSRWVELPMAEQTKKPLRARFTLVNAGDHHLELRFGPREDLIPSGSNPVVTLDYAFGRLRGEFYFTTDQSCLRGLCEEIRGLPKF